MALDKDRSAQLQDLAKKVLNKPSSPNNSAEISDIEPDQQKRQEQIENETAEDIAAANDVIEMAFKQIFEDVGASKVEFKNYKRQINLFIGEYDADMVVKHLNEKKHSQPNLSYDYITDEDNRLKGLFWCDDQAKRNYHVFGDVISFDATYRSNKYSMVFVPFTGIDNHHCNVTFGAALLASETADTYIWLLRVFLKPVGSQPKVVVTDQDPAMKKAISVVFVDTRHQLCMWHVMHKLSLKTDILTPEEFESEWEMVIAEFNLEDNDWLSDIFALRESWIPAYYRMEPMSGLMRTTSRSESENHSFGQVYNSKATLVEFMTHYETAIEAQRHTHPELIGVADCINQRYEDQPDGFVKFYVNDFQQLCTSLFEVLFRNSDCICNCSCRRFKQFGLLCRHIFYVLRLMDIREYPKQYIRNRWRKEASPNCCPEFSISREYMTELDPDVQKELSLYKDHVQSYMKKVQDLQIVAPPASSRDRFAEITSQYKNDKNPIRVPVGYESKGSGSRKRLKSKQEIAVDKKKSKSKPGAKERQCQNCKAYGHYASTCKQAVIKRRLTRSSRASEE
ncbi:protein FAR1-RELATED SEQUENCE 5-like [Helianthus annuus]|uniref:protein FAR1-RELATED SEQUENCE 5-like n=1 Tax=Helianthus annuus TaxID=4232 RepID=UPI001652B9D9|nr:protein FAR1-RELATED SEQUENCE 5-like [Helianthus annuus]